MLVLQRRVQSNIETTTTLVARQSVRNYPWLIRSRKQEVVSSGQLRQVGAPFRLWGKHSRKPCPAAVFRCGACGGHDICIIANVKAGAETCWVCARVIHGATVPDNLKSYKAWKQLLTRYKAKDLVEFEWLNETTGVTAFMRDLGQCPGDDHYLCRRVEAMGWIRGNTYWRKVMPGIWSSTADDSWLMRSGQLHQVGATIRLTGKPAVYHCGVCDRFVIESRSAVLKFGHDRCTDCREADSGVLWQGLRLSIPEWSKRTGIPSTVLHDRMRYGWDAERMLTTPAREYRGRSRGVVVDESGSCPGTIGIEKQAETGVAVPPRNRAGGSSQGV